MPETHFVNFEKRRKISTVVKEVQKYQQVSFSFIPIKPIQDFLLYIRHGKDDPEAKKLTGDEAAAAKKQLILTDDELYARSVTVEPKEEEEDDLD